jgi:hypothetical protein
MLLIYMMFASACIVQSLQLGFRTRISVPRAITLSGLNHVGMPRRLQSLQMSSNQGGGVDNPMNPQIYTEKAWDAIAKLPAYAKKYSTQYAEASLVLRALLDDGPAGLGINFRLL